eukprot:6195840-Pleurochrysis_carterae.AAC.1
MPRAPCETWPRSRSPSGAGRSPRRTRAGARGNGRCGPPFNFRVRSSQLLLRLRSVQQLAKNVFAQPVQVQVTLHARVCIHASVCVCNRPCAFLSMTETQTIDVLIFPTRDSRSHQWMHTLLAWLMLCVPAPCARVT